jgi:hypothetical protein
LEIDLRFLNALDPSDPRRAGGELLRFLPRVIEIVESVTPLYIRLHTDLTALLDEAAALHHDEPLGDQIPVPIRSDRPSISGPAGHRATRSEIRPMPPPSARWNRHRLRFAVGIAGVMAPLEILAAGALAAGGIGPVLLTLVMLCPAGAAIGVTARAMVHPDQIPDTFRRGLDPPPDETSQGLYRAAADAWTARHDDPIGV